MHAARLLLLLLTLPLSYAASISEIMYNPEGDDDNYEWVEIYNNGSADYNISGLMIGDMSSNDTLLKLQGGEILHPGGYAIVGESGINLSLYQNATVFSAGSSIGNGLGNANDTVFLYLNNTLLDRVNYSSLQGGNGNGKALCRIPDAGQLAECEPTPSAANKNGTDMAAGNARLSVYLGAATVNRSYTSLFSISIDNKSCQATDNVSVSYNITELSRTVKQGAFTRSVGCSAESGTGEWKPESSGNFTLCGIITQSSSADSIKSDNAACANISVLTPSSLACALKLWIESEDILDAGSPASYRIIVNDTSCGNISHAISVSYGIEDIFGAVERNETTEQSMGCFLDIQRQWTPERTSGAKAFLIKAGIANAYCSDPDADDNLNSRLVAVKGMTEPEKESYVNITAVSPPDGGAKFGEAVGVSVEIYRNSTDKYSVDMWIENATRISEISTVHAGSRLATYRMKVPVHIRPNCGGSFSDGTYRIIVEGLGTNASAPVNVSGISGAACGAAAGNVTAFSGSNKTGNLPYEIISYPDILHASGKFSVRLKLINDDDSPKTFSVYSYVYGDKPVSLGLSGGRWSGEWTANRKSVDVMPKQSAAVTLESMIENFTQPGKYRLNVRVKESNSEYDFTRDVDILPEEPAIAANITLTGENKTGNAQRNRITGMAANKQPVFPDMKAASSLFLHVLVSRRS